MRVGGAARQERLRVKGAIVSLFQTFGMTQPFFARIDCRDRFLNWVHIAGVMARWSWDD